MKNGLNIIKRTGAVLLAVIMMTVMIPASLNSVSAYAEPEETAEDVPEEAAAEPAGEPAEEPAAEEPAAESKEEHAEEPKEEHAEEPSEALKEETKEEPKEKPAQEIIEEPKEKPAQEPVKEPAEEEPEEEPEEEIPAGASEGNQEEQAENQEERLVPPSTEHAKHLKQRHIGAEDCSVSEDDVRVAEEIGSEKIIGKLDPEDVFRLEKISGNMVRITVIRPAESNPESRKDMTGWVKADFVVCECPREENQEDSGNQDENPEGDGGDGEELPAADVPEQEGDSVVSEAGDLEPAENSVIPETDDPEYDDGEEDFDDAEYDDWDEEDFDDSEYDWDEEDFDDSEYDWDEEDFDESDYDDWDEDDYYGEDYYGEDYYGEDYYGDSEYGGWAGGESESGDVNGEMDSGEADEEWKAAYYDYLVGNEFRVQAKLDAEEGSEYYVDCFGLKYYPDSDESEEDANFTIRFALYDWNQDGVPELFAYSGSRYTDGEYYMFTLQDGRMAYAGKVGYGSWYNLMPYRDETYNVIFSEMMDPVNSCVCIASFDELGQPVTKVLGAAAGTDSGEEEAEQETAFETPEEQELYEIYRTYYQKNSFSTALKFMDAPEDMDLNDDWWKIFVSSVNNEYTGWTEEVKEEEPVLFTAVTAKAANVRESSDKNSALVTAIPAKGTGVSVLETLTGADGKTWYRIRMEDGTAGYARSDFFTA